MAYRVLVDQVAVVKHLFRVGLVLGLQRVVVWPVRRRVRHVVLEHSLDLVPDTLDVHPALLLHLLYLTLHLLAKTTDVYLTQQSTLQLGHRSFCTIL